MFASGLKPFIVAQLNQVATHTNLLRSAPVMPPKKPQSKRKVDLSVTKVTEPVSALRKSTLDNKSKAADQSRIEKELEVEKELEEEVLVEEQEVQSSQRSAKKKESSKDKAGKSDDDDDEDDVGDDLEEKLRNGSRNGGQKNDKEAFKKALIRKEWIWIITSLSIINMNGIRAWFELVSSRFTNRNSSIVMPPKKSSSKRKGEETVATVANPFIASKKAKVEKNSKVEEDDAQAIKEPNEKTEQDEAVTENETKVVNPNQAKKKKASEKKTAVKSDDNENDDGDDDCDEKPTKTAQKHDKEAFKKASNGKDWNLKIISWNINGIRAWLDHDGLEYLKAEDPDIFCCQEIKCDKSKIPPKVELNGYHCYWLSGDTQGYSGVGLMTKVKPIKVTYGINDKKHDDEGRVIVAEYEKFFLVNSYIPNSGRGLVRLKYRMEWETAFRKNLAELDKLKPVIWCGDLNVAHTEIDIKNPASNKRNAGFTQEERDCFSNLLSDGYIDSFRLLYPKVTGAYTFWSYFRNARASNTGWRLDYFVLSERLKENLVDTMMRREVTGSDHCPIVLLLKF